MISVARRLPFTAERIWEVLVDTTTWPRWGPSVREVELAGGGTRIGPGVTGRVRTAVGVWLPFTVTRWDEGVAWAWSIGPIPATGHGVTSFDSAAATCRATIDVPSWAPAYAPLCWVALGRIGRVAGDVP